MRWFIEHSLYQYTLRLLPNLYFWSLFVVPCVWAVHWPHYYFRWKYFISFLSCAKMLTLMIILNATVCSMLASGIRLCPYLKTKLMLFKKPLNSGSSGSNQFLLKPLVALTYLFFLGWSHGLLTTMPLLRQFHCHRLAADKRLFWANTHRQRGIKWEVDFQNFNPA